MIIGYPPFFGDTPNETCKKIIKWKDYLAFPKNKVSPEAVDLMRRLITDVDKRLGYHGAEEIKSHAFFKGIDWENMKKAVPPFIPEISSPCDTRYFDKFDETAPFAEKQSQGKKDVCFVGFTYKKESERQNLNAAFEILENIKKSFKEELEDKQRYLSKNNSKTNLLDLSLEKKPQRVSRLVLQCEPRLESEESSKKPGQSRVFAATPELSSKKFKITALSKIPKIKDSSKKPFIPKIVTSSNNENVNNLNIDHSKSIVSRPVVKRQSTKKSSAMYSIK